MALVPIHVSVNPLHHARVKVTYSTPPLLRHHLARPPADSWLGRLFRTSSQILSRNGAIFRSCSSRSMAGLLRDSWEFFPVSPIPWIAIWPVRQPRHLAAQEGDALRCSRLILRGNPVVDNIAGKEDASLS